MSGTTKINDIFMPSMFKDASWDLKNAFLTNNLSMGCRNFSFVGLASI